MNGMIGRLISRFGVLLFCTGCQYHYHPRPGVEQCLLAFNEDGHFVDVRNDFKPDREIGKHFKTVLDSMDAYFASQPADKPRQILIFVHGGLTTQDADARRAEWQVGLIKQSGYYPIFIDWNAEFPSSYYEHLAYVRQGQKDHSALHFLTAPLYFLADIGSGFARAPSIWTHLSGVDWPLAATRLRETSEGQPHWFEDPTFLNVGKQYLELARWYAAGAAPLPNGATTRPISISIEPELRTPARWFWDGVQFTLTEPSKYVCVPLLAALGSPAWQNMSRRTATLFEDPLEYNVLRRRDANIQQLLQSGPPGGFELFLRALEEHIGDLDREDPRRPVRVTLVGHSMGTMVLNKALRRHPDLPVDNIVYMAAACTIRDFSQTVVPFMEHNPQTQFFNLCLHPTAEIADVELGDVPPRGSLLVWIDEFLDGPQTLTDRTLGRWENIVPHVYLIPQALWGRVHIKAFAMTSEGKTWIGKPWAGGKPEPQRHGDFSEMPYWDRTFWLPESPESASLREVIRKLRQRIQYVETHANAI